MVYAIGDELTKDITKESSRSLNRSIQRRLVGIIAPNSPKSLTERKDSDNSAWGSFMYTRIDDDDLSDFGDTSITDFGIDIYQSLIGADTKFGQFIPGVSGGYTHVDADILDAGDMDEEELDIVNFAPYLAYLINDNIYISGIVGYAYSSTGVVQSGHILNTELSVNGIYDSNDWIVKGRLGHRYFYLDAHLEDESDDFDFYYNSVVGDIELMHRFGQFTPYIGGEYEYTFPETGSGEDLFYIKAGLNYDINNFVGLSVDYKSELLLDVIDIHSVGLNLRVNF